MKFKINIQKAKLIRKLMISSFLIRSQLTYRSNLFFYKGKDNLESSLIMIKAQMKQDKQRQGQAKRKAKRAEPFAMDYEQTIIPGNTYQSWLQNSSSIVSKRGRKRKVGASPVQSNVVPHCQNILPSQAIHMN